jgi:hypothetical protein
LSSGDGCATPFQVQRQLAGRRDRGDAQAARSTERLVTPGIQPLPRHLTLEPFQRPVEDVVLGEPGADRIGRIDDQRLRLAQRQQAQAVVQIAVGQLDPGDGRVPLGARPQVGTGLDLGANLRRGVDQETRIRRRR